MTAVAAVRHEESGTSRLRLALAADPRIQVPPLHYGGIERIIATLVERLVQRGHEVTLFAHRDSRPGCHLTAYPRMSAEGLMDSLRMAVWFYRHVREGEFDLVHNFGRLANLALLLASKTPLINSYQRKITETRINWAERLSRSGSLHFTGCSRHLVNRFRGRPNWHVVYNGVPRDTYRFQADVESDAPLMFLGRLERIKGVALAIQVARESGRRLIIAGNVAEEHREYFDKEVAPRLDDRTCYVGPVDDHKKNQLLGRAAALLMPIRWEEPFGIVMVEALATGTPVVGLARGAVPEVIQDGVNGFVCSDVEEMVAAVGRLPQIRREDCRRIMEAKFSDAALVDAYERLYFRVLDRQCPESVS